MRITVCCLSVALLTVLLTTGCQRESSPKIDTTQSGITHDLVGAWRATLQFRSGPFATIHDLEFIYVFNSGGTMTESSNYDAVPPVPPAYGIWRKVGSNQFEAKYEFYMTKAPTELAEITNGGGWLPAGRGVLFERITLSDDGDSFTSTIRYEAFDQTGKPTEGGGEADGRGVRIEF